MRRKNVAADVFCYVQKISDSELAHLTIKMLAGRFGVSRCHISRSFHRECRMTLSAFITRQRLLRAERRLLLDQKMSVRSLGASLGFADCQYFISRFKEQWGESPGRYRKLMII